MELKEAVSQLVGRDDLIAVRPTGQVIMVTERLGLKDLSNGKPRQWFATLPCIVADNWEVMTRQQYAERLKASMGQGGE